MNDRNLVILVSGTGVSALATVRIIGPLVGRFLSDHFSRPVLAGRLVHGALHDANGTIDDPVVALSSDSRYADITLHGGGWVIEAAMECAIRAGFSRAIPGELAVFPDASSRLDAELQFALPLARTERAVRTLLAQPGAWKALTETRPDPHTIDQLLVDRSLQYLLHPPAVAIVGLPNAGKSTLANRLFGTDRSIVSPLAGTTRDWVGEEANLDGLIVRLIDTPGRHDTDDPIERQAILQSHSPVAEAALVIVLLDATRPLREQKALLDAFERPIVAVNKADAADVSAFETELAGSGPLSLCAREGTGVPALIERIHARFHLDKRPMSAARCWTDRQFEVARSAQRHPASLRSIW